MKRGRKKGFSLFAKPERAEWDEICKGIIYGSTEWPMVGLRQLIGDGSKLPDNFLSADYLTTPPALQKQEKAYRDKVDSLWRPLRAQFERAVLNGDANWFERQAKAIGKGRLPQRARFNAKVVHLLEIAMWETSVKQKPLAKPTLADVEAIRHKAKSLAGQKQAAQAAREAWEPTSEQKAYEAWFNAEGCAEQDAKKRLAKFYEKHPQYKPKPLTRREQTEQDRKQREHAASLKKAEPLQDDLTLTPAGKFTDTMASDIWKAVVNAALEEPETRTLIEQQSAAGETYGFKTKIIEQVLGKTKKQKRQIIEQMVAESYGFKIKERAMDAIHDIAKRLKFALEKQPRRQ